MDPAEKQRMIESMTRLIHGLAVAVGNYCEIVLHDFGDTSSSIIAIENGHITGRRVGNSLDALGFQLLRRPKEDLLNYRTETEDGKVLRCSAILLRDENGDVYGMICINVDVTGFITARRLLDEVVAPAENSVQERFEHSVDQVLNILAKDAIRATGKELSAMGREDKIAVIAYLENKGAFLIRHSVDWIAELLNVSKFTIYNYLEELKSRQATGAEAEVLSPE
jgi:predicted transcriptional regulator YheO